MLTLLEAIVFFVNMSYIVLMNVTGEYRGRRTRSRYWRERQEERWLRYVR